jgi:hypothetical protein
MWWWREKFPAPAETQTPDHSAHTSLIFPKSKCCNIMSWFSEQCDDSTEMTFRKWFEYMYRIRMWVCFCFQDGNSHSCLSDSTPPTLTTKSVSLFNCQSLYLRVLTRHLSSEISENHQYLSQDSYFFSKVKIGLCT